MLFTNTVSRDTLELLKKISNHPKFSDFYLVGGTALALQIGHRISIDLDFFSSHPFDESRLVDVLVNEFNTQINRLDKHTVLAKIDGIKVDFITHQYPFIENLLKIDEINILGIKDIAALKLNALKNRGSRKDFVDIHALLDQFSLKEIIAFHDEKYPNHNAMMILKSLVFFDDARNEPMPKMIKQLDWNIVELSLSDAVEKYLTD